VSHTAARTTGKPLRRTAVGLAVVATVIVATLAFQSIAPWTPSFSEALRGEDGRTAALEDGVVTEADGSLPDSVTVFDHSHPGVSNLEPDLLHALREAATNAAGHGIQFNVNSGWRSPAYQNELLRKAVSKYGSEEKAARWVAAATTSPHVSGQAVDVGDSDATAWLSAHGAHYGLCQTYRNEPWHYELRPSAADHGCPPMYSDPSHDPRMQQ
jgi:D-alanyl-D-alanine carboxypeptidase